MKKVPEYKIKVERVPHRQAVARSRKIYHLLHGKVKAKAAAGNQQEKVK